MRIRESDEEFGNGIGYNIIGEVFCGVDSHHDCVQVQAVFFFSAAVGTGVVVVTVVVGVVVLFHSSVR